MMTPFAFAPVNIPGYWPLPELGSAAPTPDLVVPSLSALVACGILAAVWLAVLLLRRRRHDRATLRYLTAQSVVVSSVGAQSAPPVVETRAQALAAERAWGRVA